MKYGSTRSGIFDASFIDVVLRGMAPDGGLYVPESFPQLNWSDLQKCSSYADIAHAVIAPYCMGEISDVDLKSMIQTAYADFRHPAIAPLRQMDDHGLWLMELFHGQTYAFKDVALQFLGQLFNTILTQQNRSMTIVGATSGDTGSAAIMACAPCSRIQIYILHPHGRVSDIQRRQMTSINASNVHNIAVHGDFDDCQALVKSLFADEDFRTKINLSAINSINWARIIAQSVYYVSACLALNASPEKPLHFSVPTGNFGNIYAAYVAKKMGAPIGDLVIGTNRNDILTRFVETGTMKAESVTQSHSPSMDIQISSNFERYLFEKTNRDPVAIKRWMDDFKSTQSFSVDRQTKTAVQNDFYAYRASDDDTLQTIKTWHDKNGIILDPHSAVGVFAAQAYQSQTHQFPIISLACAHPAKFLGAVQAALPSCDAEIAALMPESLKQLSDKAEYVTQMPVDLCALKDHILQIHS
jgi:threonine synthase